METTTRAASIAALTAAAVLLVGCAIPTSDSSSSATPRAGASAESAQPTESTPPSAAEEIDPTITAAMEALKDAGAEAVVVDLRNGDDHVTAATGTADGETAADADAPMRIASITKSMTATVIMQLVEEGALSLDTAVDELLPGLLDAPSPVTVEQLLNHTSGLPDYFGLLVPDLASYQALADSTVDLAPTALVETAQSVPWTSPPGETFAYSNTNYVVLDLVAEAVTGERMPALLEARIFEPLGLEHTAYPDDSALPEGALRGSVSDGGTPLDTSIAPPAIWGAGAAVISTVGDVTLFFQALFGGDLVSAESVALMQDVGPEGYGLGLLAGGDACSTELVYGQRGNGVGYRAMAFGSPDGERFVTIGWTGGGFDPASDPTLAAGNALLATALATTC